MINIKETICPSKSWSNRVEVHEKCILNNGTIYMDSLVHDKIRMLTGKITTEWLGYLLGRIEGTIAYVDDIFIPLQKVNAVNVKVAEQTLPMNIIGTVHSHHDMGSFLSHTDHQYLVANHPVTIVASHRGLLAKFRVKAPCEAFMLLDADIHVEDALILKEFLEQNLIKIQGNTVNETSQKLNWLGKIWKYPAVAMIAQPIKNNKGVFIAFIIIAAIIVLIALVGRYVG
jgi:proteasome lid subunit RPN8/RPN11